MKKIRKFRVLKSKIFKGSVQIIVLLLLVVVGMMLLPVDLPKIGDPDSPYGPQYCREFVNDPNPPKIELPEKDSGGTPTGQTVTYKLIKSMVPIRPSGFQGGHHVRLEGDTTIDGKSYTIFNPAGGAGKSYDFNTEDGVTDITFSDYGLIYLRHLDPSGNPEMAKVGDQDIEIMDIYQDISKPPLPLAANILKCLDVGAVGMTTSTLVIPNQTESQTERQLQLEWFKFKESKYTPKAWWTPECKPAIYLYPKEKTLVNVKVYPKGFLTYTDPLYDPKTGWNVTAYPGGKLEIQNSKFETQNYDYLYYESKIQDEVINKPNKGWVIKKAEFRSFFNDLLPKLGLNNKERQDFIDYWQKALNSTPYYFVGVMDPENIDQMEPLKITPTPDLINRVRIYFEQLDQPKSVEAPDLESNYQTSNMNFQVTEWGGMVKNDLNHPFTCSQ